MANFVHPIYGSTHLLHLLLFHSLQGTTKKSFIMPKSPLGYVKYASG